MSYMQYAGALLLCGLCTVLLVACERGGSGLSEVSDPSASKYLPTAPKPREVGERLVGPVVYTVDARSHDLWMYFDFSRGAVVAVQDPHTDDWDLAFRRHAVRTNGGDTNPSGQTAVAELSQRDFTAVTSVAEDTAFLSDVRPKKRLSTINPVLEKWYSYSYMANVLMPKPVVYLIRTQDGKYARLRFLSYYCKDGVAGCMTFEYVYQGDGSLQLAEPPA